MIKNRSGVIITVSSGFPDISTYCASKFGILGLTESLAWEVGNYNRRSMPYIQVRWKKEAACYRSLQSR